MNKKLIIWGILGIVILILIISPFRMYNGLVSAEESVNSQWANVETAYQRRADLIPNLVNTVKGVANFEQQTLTAVVEARAQATQVKVDPAKLDEASMQKFQQAQDKLGSSLSKLLLVVEKYPELKATQNFLELQSQIEGSENRISVERNKFNEVAKTYNTNIRKFPRNIVAGMFGFEKKAYFKSSEGSEKAPEVKF